MARAFYLVVFTVMTAAAATATGAQAPVSPAAIDATVTRVMKTFEVPGIAVAVIKDDQVVYSKGAGVASLKDGRKVDERSLFVIASNTKAFVAASLAILVDEGKLRWTDKVTDVIPEFRMYDPYVTAEFTIEDLLTHRSGLGLGAGDLMQLPEGSDFTRADVIRNLRFLKPASSFRSKFDYDNQLYIVAGEVVARVSGMTWEDFVEQRIMQPLGMRDSRASRARAAGSTNFAMPHASSDGGPVAEIAPEVGEVINAAGGIVSNLADMSRWVRMQLQGGVYGDGKHLFSAKAQAAMWAPHTILLVASRPGYNTNFAAYGLGWTMFDARGYKVVAHSGAMQGMVTQVVMVPGLKLGIIVLTNQEQSAAFEAISMTILDSYLGVPLSDRIAERRALLDKRLAADAADAAEVRAALATPSGQAPADVTGTYRDPWFGDVTISSADGVIHFASIRSPNLAGDMRFYRGTSYIVRWKDRTLNADAFVNFGLDNEGKPNRMTMEAVSSLTDFSFDFQDLDFKPVR